jgi:hypothetical protein
MANWICSNALAAQGLLDLGVFLGLYGLSALLSYFSSGLFEIVQPFILALESQLTKDAFYDALQLMIGSDPASGYLGAQLTQWAQGNGTGNPTNPELGDYAKVMGLWYGVLQLANQLPSSPHVTNASGFQSTVNGVLRGSATIGGFASIPDDTGSKPISTSTALIPVPIDPTQYEAMHGFPPPTPAQLATFLLNDAVPKYGDYPSVGSGFAPYTQYAVDIFNAYSLWLAGCSQQAPPPPPPGGTTPPPPTPTCPEGYHWDATLGTCVPDLVIPPGQGGGGVGDELTQGFAEVLNALNALAEQVKACCQQATQGGDQSQPSDCCDKLAAAISSVKTGLDGIAAAVTGLLTSSGGGGGPLPPPPQPSNLDEVVEAFRECVCTALEKIAAGIGEPTTPTPARLPAPPELPEYQETTLTAALAKAQQGVDLLVSATPPLKV